MQYEKLYTIIIERLEKELPSYISYHNVEHTKNVIIAAEHIALSENITEEELILVKTAALFHDTGFMQHHKEHEEASCIIAWEYLPDYDYTKDQINEICRMIMSTKFTKSLKNHLGEILCDADVYYIGGDNYFYYADKLFHEFKKLGKIKTHIEWNIYQIEFFNNHTFYTNTAKHDRNNQKHHNLKQLKDNLESSLGHSKGIKTLEILKDSFFIIFGIIIAGFALKGFLVPNRFFDGGVTGISLLIHELYHINLAIVIILFNLPLIIISYFSVNLTFALKTFISVILLGLCLIMLPDVAYTSDKLLISIFGGVFLGIGIGFVMRAGAALDGIEVLALYTLKRTSFTISEIILGINIFIFSIAAFKFGIETALYSILTYYAASKSIDYVVEGIQAYSGITIISEKSEEIKYNLVNKLGKAITVYKSVRGFLPGKFQESSNCDIIFTIVTRLEMRKLKNLVYEIDPKAFVFANTVKEASGGIIQHRRKH